MQLTNSYKQVNYNQPLNQTKKIYYGLSILKFLLAFSVVCVHCFDKNSTNNKIILNLTRNRLFYVPCFFIMSFYFNCNNLLSRKRRLLLQRIIRLLIPYIFWPIIIWLINCYFNKKYIKQFPDSYEILKLQLFFGHSYMSQFWFQWNIIVITILLYLIILIFCGQALFILQLLLILSYISQYNGYYYLYVYLKYPKYNRYTFSRIFEMIPYAVTGFTFGYFQIINLLEKNKIKAIILSTIIYNTIIDYNIFRTIYGVTFCGISLNIQSICIFFIFSSLPSFIFKNKNFKQLLTILTNYTGGVYYLHVSIRLYLNLYVKQIKKGTFFGIIIIYFICYIICYFGMQLFKKTPFKYLFF